VRQRALSVSTLVCVTHLDSLLLLLLLQAARSVCVICTHYCCELTQRITLTAAAFMSQQVLASPFAMGPTDNWLAEFLKWSAVSYYLLQCNCSAAALTLHHL
jgi:hypothetical protein